jgi:hypothetical protein
MLQAMHLDLAFSLRIRRSMARSIGTVVVAVFMREKEG